MGGLVCCTISTERKDDNAPSITMAHHRPQSASSPGKPSLNSDSLWEVGPELISAFEKDIKFTKTGLMGLFD